MTLTDRLTALQDRLINKIPFNLSVPQFTTFTLHSLDGTELLASQWIRVQEPDARKIALQQAKGVKVAPTDLVGWVSRAVPLDTLQGDTVQYLRLESQDNFLADREYWIHDISWERPTMWTLYLQQKPEREDVGLVYD